MSENSNVANPKYSSTPPFDDIDQFASSYDEEGATTPDSLFVNQRDSDASSLGSNAKGVKKRRMKKTMKKTMKKRKGSKGSKGKRF
jgi:hypothetical protein